VNGLVWRVLELHGAEFPNRDECSALRAEVERLKRDYDNLRFHERKYHTLLVDVRDCLEDNDGKSALKLIIESYDKTGGPNEEYKGLKEALKKRDEAIAEAIKLHENCGSTQRWDKEYGDVYVVDPQNFNGIGDILRKAGE